MSSIDDYLKISAETESLKVMDDCLRCNAENASGAGLEVRVTRTYDGVGLSNGRVCRWCLDRCRSNMTLEEAYRIGAFQRHPGCGCIIEYTSKKGVKTVQTGKYSGWSFSEELDKRKSIGLEASSFIDELGSRIKQFTEINEKELYNTAASGGIYKGTYDQAINKVRPQLEKSIRKHIQQAELHEWKIQHPEEYMVKQDIDNNEAVKNAIKKWERDRRRNAQQAAIEIEAWRRLYG